MRNYERLKDMITSELDRIANKGELNSQNLEMVDKLTHSLKSIETIQAMNEYDDIGYSGKGRMYAKRDSLGRYSKDGTIMNYLHEMEMSAPDEHTRRMVQEWKRQAERE